MYARILLSTALLAVAPLAAASQSSRAIDELAQDSGLTHDDICMLLGAAADHPQYLTSYNRVQRQFIKTVGYPEYEHLINHEYPNPKTAHSHDSHMTAQTSTS